MAAPLVSVIVPAYKAAPFLAQLAGSLQAQTFRDFEVLVHDDGSGDDTAKVVAPFLSDVRFRFSQWSRNRGVAAATAELLSRARGELWCHPGADDVLKPDFIERRVAAMENHPNAVIVHGPGEVIDEHGRPASPLPLPTAIPEVLNAERGLRILLQHNIINTPSVLVRTSATRLVLSRFNENWQYAQDWFLWILHLGLGGSLVWDRAMLHQYRVHSQSLTHHPGRAAIREAEVRLVPMAALSAAAHLSVSASECWAQFRDSLYAMWLRRAWKLRRQNLLDENWMRIATKAFYGQALDRSLTSELMRHICSILSVTVAERRARRRTRFPVSGLAAVEDPIFQ
jgi:glycosyltransferase involved in cell wall biosynthesis